MRVFAISDPHLSLAKPKEMDIFGDNWKNHWVRIAADWRERVTQDDVVLVAGDISWAMKLEEAQPDLDAIGALPGHKLLIKGNHDYWHGSLARTRAALRADTYFLQNDAVSIGGVAFAGTRGWKQPGDQDFDAEDEKIYRRETERLKLTLAAAKKLGGDMIAMTHFPPYTQRRGASPMTDLFAQAGTKIVVYGHIHGDALKKHDYDDAEIDGVRYILTSCDALDFKLKEIAI